MSEGRAPGWREVILVTAGLVAFVFALVALTAVLPAGAQDLVFRTPLAIVVLVAGTAIVLVGISRRPRGD